MREVKRRQILPSAKLCASRPPVQPSRNHQVQHQPEIAFESEGNALADTSQLAHLLALHRRNRRLRRTQQKSARHPHLLQRLANNALLERSHIRGDVGQFRHRQKKKDAHKGHPSNFYNEAA